MVKEYVFDDVKSGESSLKDETLGEATGIIIVRLSIAIFHLQNHWQPTQAMELSDGFAEEVGLGTPIFYDVTYKLPYRTAAGPFQIHTEITSGPIQVKVMR